MTDDFAEDLAPPSLLILEWQDKGDWIEVQAAYNTPEWPCPRCGTLTERVHDRRIQRKRDQVDGEKPVWLVLQKRRFRCTACGAVFVEPDLLCGPRRRSTQRLRALLREAVLAHPVKHVALTQQVSRVAVYRALHEGSSNTENSSAARKAAEPSLGAVESLHSSG